jgi:uncharacterized protein YndB with AHSA1/START domain
VEIDSEITIGRTAADVFAYIARAEALPEYVTDFETVVQESEGDPGVGTRYSYKMRRGAQGSFEWTEFEPTSRLSWRGPAVKVGPGSMAPAGRWEIAPVGDGARVKLVMAPTPGGLFKLLAPFMAAGMRKGNEQALELLKQRLEAGSPGA